MTEFLIYGRDNCPYCVMAKNLLEQNGWAYEYRDVMANPEHRRIMMESIPGVRTVPQIFWRGEHIGGFDQLRAAILAGRIPRLGDGPWYRNAN